MTRVTTYAPTPRSSSETAPTVRLVLPPAPVPAGDRRQGPRGVRAWLLQGAALLTVGVVASLLVQRIAARLPVPATSNVPTVLVEWGCAAALAVAAVMCAAARLRPWLRNGISAGLLSGVATGTLAVPLHGTYYYLGGIAADQQFRTQYLTRLATSWAPSDMNYAGLPPFYPSGWFWPAARVADLLHLPAWQAYKPLAVLTVAVVPVAAYWLWSRLVGHKPALAIAFVVVAVGLAGPVVEPYSWIVAALVPPVVVVFWRLLGRRGWHRVAGLLGVGVFVGGALCTYTLYAGFVAVSFGALALWAAWSAGPGARAVALGRSALALLVVGLAAAAVAAPVWGPYLLAVLRHGAGPTAAAHFLSTDGAALPAPMLSPTPWGLLLAAGFGYAVWQAVSPAGRDRRVLAPLGMLVGCVYGWYALSTVTLGLGTTLLAFRVNAVLLGTLGSAGVLCAHRGWLLARHRWPELSWTGRSPIGVVAALVVVLAGVSVVQDNARILQPLELSAYQDPYPSGPNAQGVVLDDREERWVGPIASSIAARTRRPADQLVVLSTNYSLMSFEPYRGFQQITPHYANPLSDYEAREAFVQQLARTSDAAAARRLLDTAPWAAPTVFVLSTLPDGLHVRLGRDAFPADPNIVFDDVVFDPRVFAGWSSEQVGPYTVVVAPGA